LQHTHAIRTDGKTSIEGAIVDSVTRKSRPRNDVIGGSVETEEMGAEEKFLVLGES